MPRYQGFEVNDYVFTLDALPLKPPHFCNTGVNRFKNLQDEKYFKQFEEVKINSVNSFFNIASILDKEKSWQLSHATVEQIMDGIPKPSEEIVRAVIQDTPIIFVLSRPAPFIE